MKYVLPPAALALVTTALLATASLPSLAASSAASTASDSVSTSVGSVSDSIRGSSDSSSKKDVAAGDYKVIDMAAAPDKPGMVRLTLLAVNETNAENAFFLLVPERVAQQAVIATGQVVAARTRPYGTEFAKADSGQAFFLVLQDEWYRELRTTAVVL